MAKGGIIPLNKGIVMCQWKQSIKENLIKFSWLNKSRAGKDDILHQAMTKWRGNVMGQDRCGVKNQSRELHYQDASYDNFCGWSCAVQQNLGMLREGRRTMTSANIMKSGLGRIVINSSEWGKGWWMKFNANSCKVMSIKGKALCASCTEQNMDSVSIASENSLLWSF